MKWESLHGEWTLMSIRVDARHPFNETANGTAIYLSKKGVDKTIFVFEDENDGYRSSATTPIVMEAPLDEVCNYPEYVRVPVVVSELKGDYGKSEGIELRDARNGKVVLRLGTDNSDDYYPCFVSEWKPDNIDVNQQR